MTKKFPKFLYATIAEEDTRDEYIRTDQSSDGNAEIGVTKKCGVYQLVNEIEITGKVEVTQPKPKKRKK